MPRLLFDPERHPELTYADVFLVPNNPTGERLMTKLSAEEQSNFNNLTKKAEEERKQLSPGASLDQLVADIDIKFSALAALRSFIFELGVKYPIDVRTVSRDQVDITPTDGFGNIPVTVANMNAVAGKRMAEAMAVMGGSAAIPQDKEDWEMRQIAKFLHSRDVRIVTPITVNLDTRVHDLMDYMEKRDLDTAIVTERQDSGEKFIGLVRLQTNGVELQQGVIPSGTNQDTPIRKYVRTGDCITAPEGISDADALTLMEQHRLHFLPVLSSEGMVKGVLTKKFLAQRWRYHAHVDAEHGGLAMLATIGALNNNPIDRAKLLLDLGVKGIIFDTAHFDQGIEPYSNVEAAAGVIAQARRKVLLVAGNVVTPEATRDILAAGADVAKVGIGPGAMCTTRMETGVGRPQFTAVLQCAEEAAKHGKYVWADGGIQHPRDVALALAAGASQVMIGSLFTPTLESPGPLLHDDNGFYKVNYGMASRQAAILRNVGKESRDRMQELFRSMFGHRSEGINESNIYRRYGMKSVVDYVHWLLDGLTSSMTYAGARNLAEFRKFATVGVQTMSGYKEGEAKSTL